MQGSVTVLYDKHCRVCRLLAALLSELAPRQWHVTPWQGATPGAEQQHPEELVVLVGCERLEGEAAWRYLVEHLPRLKAYQNIAARVGLSPPRTARWLRAMGHRLRRLCGQCPYLGTTRRP